MNYKNPKETFLKLIEETYPNGYEYEVLKYLPNLKKDNFGNYYKIIGEEQPKVMFTSHLDTYGYKKQKVNYTIDIIDGEEIVKTDGNSILGADDKAGVTVMLYMIEHNIPGIYYFFIGEESNGIGSEMLSNNFEDLKYVSKVKSCISFDRRGYESAITMQLGQKCCSDTFVEDLISQYEKNGLHLKKDSTGIFTDSANLMIKIPECTNISVGYNNEHSNYETQNLTYLKKLCNASILIDWNNLKIERNIETRILKKYESFIKNLK